MEQRIGGSHYIDYIAHWDLGINFQTYTRAKRPWPIENNYVSLGIFIEQN